MTVANNYSHKNRYVYGSQSALHHASSNNLAYVKGVDFNSQNKYDFDVINN